MTFAREGACVLVADINMESALETVRLITDAGGAAQATQVDITD